MNSDVMPEEISHRQMQSRRLQTEMFSLEADQNRLIRKHDELVAELRRLQMELSRLKEDIENKSLLERSLAREVTLGQEAIARVKKQLHTL